MEYCERVIFIFSRIYYLMDDRSEAVMEQHKFNFNKLNLYINPNMKGFGKSPTLAINELSYELEQERKKVYKFGFGQSPFPVPDFMVEELKSYAKEKDYLPVDGLPALREAVAKFYREVKGLDVDKSQVLIAPGSKQLLFLIQFVLNAELLIPVPCWVTYIPQARMLGRRIHTFQTTAENNWQLDPNEFEEYLKNHDDSPKLLLLNYFNNPTGSEAHEETLMEIARIAREYGVIVVSDEIYDRLTFTDHYYSIVRYYPEGTIISGGLSKWAGAGGWRLGTFIFPKELKEIQMACAVLASETYSCVAAPIQYAAVAAYNDREQLNQYIAKSNRVLKTISTFCTNQLKAAGVKVNPAAGGFYIFIDFEKYRQKLLQKGIRTSNELMSTILQESGVAMLPGTAFGMPLDSLTARLAFVNFNGGYALEKIDEFDTYQSNEDFIKDIAPDVYNGILALVNWLDQFNEA